MCVLCYVERIYFSEIILRGEKIIDVDLKLKVECQKFQLKLLE